MRYIDIFQLRKYTPSGLSEDNERNQTTGLSPIRTPKSSPKNPAAKSPVINPVKYDTSKYNSDAQTALANSHCDDLSLGHQCHLEPRNKHLTRERHSLSSGGNHCVVSTHRLDVNRKCKYSMTVRFINTTSDGKDLNSFPSKSTCSGNPITFPTHQTDCSIPMVQHFCLFGITKQIEKNGS